MGVSGASAVSGRAAPAVPARASYDVLVVGRPTYDLVFTGLPAWPVVGRETYAGGLVVSAGGAFNGAAALARLGLRVGMIGSVGTDWWSQQGLAAMEAEGVANDLMRVLDRPLPSVSVCMAYDGDRGFLTYEAPTTAVDGACAAHALTVLARERAAFLQCGLTADLAAYARVARARGMRVVVDCGWDEPWLTSHQIRALMPLADVVFANAPEACCIAGDPDPVVALRRLGELAPFVVVKRGAAGSSALVEGREEHAPTEPVEVVDATGAGDCFNACFLYGLHRGYPIADCLRLGNVCGGLNVGVPGGFAGAPTEDQLLAHARQCSGSGALVASRG